LRNTAGQEVDLVEERDGRLAGFEFKWGNRGARPPKAWRETVPDSTFTVIDRENYLDFLLP
jgi:hypothetical protein